MKKQRSLIAIALIAACTTLSATNSSYWKNKSRVANVVYINHSNAALANPSFTHHTQSSAAGTKYSMFPEKMMLHANNTSYTATQYAVSGSVLVYQATVGGKTVYINVTPQGGIFSDDGGE